MAELQLRSNPDGTDDPGLMAWRPLVLHEHNISHFWLGLSHMPLVLLDVFGGSRQSFMETLLNPRNLFFELGEGEGVVACLNVIPRLSCIVYPIMFDKHLRGKEDIFKEILQYLFNLLQLERVGSFVNADCETTGKFLYRCGFKREGRMRCAALREFGFVDQLVFGLLREEL